MRPNFMSMNPLSGTFANRTTAGLELARVLQKRFAGKPDIVLGLPRGGVPVAFEIAQVLGVLLDVMPVRKIAVPHIPSLPSVRSPARRSCVNPIHHSVFLGDGSRN